MPLYKLPQTLYSVALKITEVLVETACINIESWYGNFDADVCKFQVESLKKYLSCNLSSTVLDDLCEHRSEEKHSLRLDNRIRLAIHMHRNVRKFSVDIATSKCKFPVDDPFWIDHLSQIPFITALDLHLICTDEILEVIGRCCPLLEEINIVSRLEQDKRAKSCTFNALKLKFFVSDEGLAHLSHCRKLKKLAMNKMLRSHYVGRMMTDNGIRKLLRTLPNLQFISYGDTGTVIAQGMEDIGSLNLQGLSDFHPSPFHIEAAARLCPKLQYLSLSMPTGNMSQIDGSGGNEEGGVVLQALSRSTICVSGLELCQFRFEENMLNLLKVKGEHITNLELNTSNAMSSKDVISIGRNCPFIQGLCIKNMGPEPASAKVNSWNFCNSFDGKFPPFSCLLGLQLNGQDWNPEIILLVCLSYAFRLKTLSLQNFSYLNLLDKIMSRIFFINPLKDLIALYLYVGCPLSYNGIQQVLENCPKINQLTFVEHEFLQSEDVALLKEEVQKSNFDLNICSLGVN
ncbi:uncharacterized protein LOC124158728 [Ischnura elegans]|uniref:uncharacterized protein LOC124158728 n=1 Tax=Ischnura elegans TaxID=197161 RepID=UPI001ED8919F|nr:uncharacterized protein LOC124158728 [Ischnura elegans]XP_046389947.1 uncharacterized protein LOC124158728 [Ischnura elegans]XP_046389948.1 uncharacterized protein LOC124158728 [Ischnura elegans]